MNNPTTQNITILHDTQEWSTDLDGEIGEIRVNGKKLNDIHDVASKIDSMTRVIRLLAYLATALAVSAVLMCGGIGLWLLGNSYQIENTLNSAEDRFSKTSLTIRTQNNRMKNKLLSLGWHFNGKDWQQIVNTKLKPSK